ncbi:MAG TPA: hypothetical protein VLH09_07755 [Bryobacteraceae bacterium]|nr:hypothetical protein [Bryobacteraceae bacterium]
MARKQPRLRYTRLKFLAHGKWDTQAAMKYILSNHTHEHRAALFREAVLSLAG